MNHIIEILDDDDDDDNDDDEDEEILDDDNLVHIHIGNVNAEAMGVPLYNGGFDKPFTFTFTAPNHETAAAVHHGVNQLALYGLGYEINIHNIHYTLHGMFDEAWIVPLQHDHFLRTERRGGWCVGCGYFLVNPHRPLEPVAYYHSQPESGNLNYRNYWHYACANSHFFHYALIRYQASLCLYYPHLLSWAVSSNQLHHKNQDSFTYYEMVDLFVGMKLSGALDDPGRKPWNRIRQYCYILRLNGKTNEQMRQKYRDYSENNRYERYFTDLFHNTVIEYNAALEPV